MEDVEDVACTADDMEAMDCFWIVGLEGMSQGRLDEGSKRSSFEG